MQEQGISTFLLLYHYWLIQEKLSEVLTIQKNEQISQVKSEIIGKVIL